MVSSVIGWEVLPRAVELVVHRGRGVSDVAVAVLPPSGGVTVAGSGLAKRESETGAQSSRVDAEDCGDVRNPVAEFAQGFDGFEELSRSVLELVVGEIDGQVEAADRALDRDQRGGRG
jgi:hypothetical protein